MTEHKERYIAHLSSDYWQDVKIAVRDRDGNRCRVCNSSESLEVHHRTYAHLGTELDHLNDLTLLCAKCHSLYHGTQRGGGREPGRRVASPVKPQETAIAANSRPEIGQGMAKARGGGYNPLKHDWHVPAPKPPPNPGSPPGQGKRNHWVIMPYQSKRMVMRNRDAKEWAMENVPGGRERGWMNRMGGMAVPIWCIRPKYRNRLREMNQVFPTKEQAEDAIRQQAASPAP